MMSNKWKLAPSIPNDNQQLAGAQACSIDTTPLNKLWLANKIYKAMLADCQELESEAVAWKITDGLGKEFVTEDKSWTLPSHEFNEFTSIPLYTTPQPNRVAELEKVLKASVENGEILSDCIDELEAKLKMAVDALERECGRRCNAEYNPCSARGTLKQIGDL